MCDAVPICKRCDYTGRQFLYHYLNPPQISPNASSFFCPCPIPVPFALDAHKSMPPLPIPLFPKPPFPKPPPPEAPQTFPPNKSGCCCCTGTVAGASHKLACAGGAGVGEFHPDEVPHAPTPFVPIMFVACGCTWVG